MDKSDKGLKRHSIGKLTLYPLVFSKGDGNHVTLPNIFQFFYTN